MFNLGSATTIVGLAAGLIIFLYNNWDPTWFSQEPYSYQDTHCNPYSSSSDSDEDSQNRTRRTETTDTIKLPGPDDECSICCSHLMRRSPYRSYCIVCLPSCEHWFHQSCAIRLLEYNPSCPNCRSPIDRERLRTMPVRLINANDQSGDGPSSNSMQENSHYPNPSTSRASAPQEVESNRSRAVNKNDTSCAYREDSLD